MPPPYLAEPSHWTCTESHTFFSSLNRTFPFFSAHLASCPSPEPGNDPWIFSLSPSSPNPISRPFPLCLSMCFRAYLLFCTLTLTPEVQGLNLAPPCDCHHPWASFQFTTSGIQLLKGTFQNAIWTWTSPSPSSESFLTASSVDNMTFTVPLNQASLHLTVLNTSSLILNHSLPHSLSSIETEPLLSPPNSSPSPTTYILPLWEGIPDPSFWLVPLSYSASSFCARLLHCTLHVAL